MSEEKIDSLDIQIETSLGSDTAKQISKASSAIKRMAENLKDVDTSRLEKLNSLFKGTKELESYAKSIKTVSSSIKSLSKIDQSGLQNVKTVLGEISGMKFDFSQLEGLKNIDFTGLSKFGKSLNAAKANAKQMSDALKPIEERMTIGQQMPPAKFLASNATLAELKRQKDAIGFTPTVNRPLKSLARDTSTGNMQQFDTSAIQKYVDDFAEKVNIGKQKSKELKDAINSISSVNPTVKTSGLEKMFAVSSKLSTLLKTLGSGLKFVGGKALNLGKSLISSKTGANGLSGSLNGGYKAFLRYGLGIRSTFALLNKLRASFGNAMNNLVQYSSTTNRAVSSMWNSLNALKNSLATAFAPVINSVAPYVSALIDMLTDAMNTIAQFFAAITGSKTVVVAKKQNKNYAASLGKIGSAAGGSADKVKDLADALDLLDFDEINKLSDNTSGGGSGGSGGSGGGSGGSGVAGMFETETVDSAFKDLADMFKNGDWDAIGDIIANGINSAVGKLDAAISWDNVGDKITNICNGITSIFNRVVDKMDWSMIGKTVGDGVNTVLYTINLLYDGVDWENLGSKVATAVNSIFTTVDFDAVGEFLVRKFNAVWEFAAGFFETLDGKKIGEDLGTTLNSAMEHLNLKAAKGTLSGALNTLSDIIEGFNETVNWDGISSGITTFFDGVFDDVKWKELGANLGTLVGNLAKVIIETVMDPTMQDKLFSAGSELVGGFVKGALDALTNGAFSDLVEKLKNIPILGNIIDNSEFSLTPFLDQLRKQLNNIDTSSLTLQLRANLGLDVSADELLGDFLSDWNAAHPEAKIDDSLANGGDAEWKAWAKEFNATNPKVTIPDEVANGGGKTIMNWLLDAYKQNPELVIPTKTDKTGKETAVEYLGGWSAFIQDNPAVLNTGTDKTGGEEAETYETSWNYANPTGDMQVACSTLPAKMAQWFVALFTKQNATGEIDVETSKTGGELKQGLSTQFNQFSINPFSVDVEGKLKDKLDTSKIGNITVDAGVKATGIDPNGKTLFAPFSASDMYNNGKSMYSGFYASDMSNNGKSMYSTFKASSMNNNDKSMFSTFKASSMNENGKSMYATFKADSLKPDGHSMKGEYTATDINPLKGISVKGTVKAKNDISKKTNGKNINAVAGEVKVKKVTGVSGAINKFLKMIGLKEKGGIYSNGSWSNLPQFAGGGIITSQKIGRFAGGGLPMHGTMFAAGERGAEVVGNINGRTEVLNQSQIASAIYAAMIQAMKQQNVSVDVSLQGDANTMFKVVQKKARQYTVQTGKMPFAY